MKQQHTHRRQQPAGIAASSAQRRGRTLSSIVVASGAVLFGVGAVTACGSVGSEFHVNGHSSSSSGNTNILTIDDGGLTTITLPDGAVIQVDNGGCDGGSSDCCPSGGVTTITGKVLDPAGVHALYNVSVFVEDPNAPLPDLASAGISCGCSALFPADVLGMGTTDANGSATSRTSRSPPAAPTRSSACRSASASRRASTSPAPAPGATSTSTRATTARAPSPRRRSR